MSRKNNSFNPSFPFSPHRDSAGTPGADPRKPLLGKALSRRIEGMQVHSSD
jgi:hypothetical protein